MQVWQTSLDADMEQRHLWLPGGISFSHGPIGDSHAYRCGFTEMVRILEEKIACLSYLHGPYLIGISIVWGVNITPTPRKL